MTMSRMLAVMLLLVSGIATAEQASPETKAVKQSGFEAKVVPLLTKALSDYPGKEVEMIEVEYPPGSVDPVHRHDAHGFIYVIEGSIMMGVQGGKGRTTCIPLAATLARRNRRSLSSSC